MAKKYYAVKKGKKPGVYKTWNECKAQVDGYSGAVYKSFPTMEEASKFVSGSSVVKSKKEAKKVVSSDTNISVSSNSEKIVAYVDGSYNNAMKVYSGGSVILYKDETHELSKVGYDSNLVDMRNVAGELLGVKNVINWIVEKQLKNVTVEFHYDYEGIERWANYEWKANKDGTKEYQKFINDFRSLGHEVLFVKVKAHSGIFYNEEADRLAGEAISNYQRNGQLVSEEKSDYRVLFEKTFLKATDKKSKFMITYKEYDLNEKDIIKFIKSTWKSKGYLMKDIKDLSIELDLENQMIKWSITDNHARVMMDEYSLV